jgi:DNA-binding NarL/FixJ family response regulator
MTPESRSNSESTWPSDRVGLGKGAGKIRVSVIEDHEATRQNLESFIRLVPDFETAGFYHGLKDAYQEIFHRPPDVILMDIRLETESGIQGIARLSEHAWPDRKPAILAFTWHQDVDTIYGAIKAGATGYVLKSVSMEELRDAIREAHLGGGPISPAIAGRIISQLKKLASGFQVRKTELTPRENEVLRLLAEAHTNKAIAAHLEISISTVATHIEHILEKLHVKCREEAIRDVNREWSTQPPGASR